jgi:ribonucleoside-diphosphate reductase alpha chain
VQLRFPVEPNVPHIVEEMVPARQVWNEIVESAHDAAEPGVLFWGNITKMSPADCYVDDGYKTISTNPCSEIPLSAYDSCRLMVVNLTTCVTDPFTDDATFDWSTFVDVVTKAQRLMDDMVDIEIEHIDLILDKIRNDPEPDGVKALELRLWEKIKDAAVKGRRTGLGLVGVGDTLAALGIKYGSDESIRLTEKIYKTLALTAYACSVTMAEERGAFPIYDHEKECKHPFIKRIMSADKKLLQRYVKHGRRNIALTTTAPTGTVSSLTQTTSGIEPAIMLEYVRRRKINPDDKTAKVNFVDKDTGDKYQTYTVIHKGFQLWQQITGKEDPADSPYHEATALDVDWVKSIELQAVAQKWICHAISKTCNLPEDTTIEQVASVYETAWKHGCKGLTIYRQGSRAGIIVEDDGDEIKALVRPQKLNCDIHRAKVTVQGEPNTYMVLVGLLDNRPYEIFCGLSEMVEIPRKFKTGHIIKNGKKNGIATYNLAIPIDEEDKIEFKNIVDVFDNPTYGAFSRTISLALRHKIPLQLITEQLLKDKHSDLMSFSRAIARVLKGYIPDGTKTSWQKECPDCRSGDIVYVDGCVRCMSCGWTLCE